MILTFKVSLLLTLYRIQAVWIDRVVVPLSMWDTRNIFREYVESMLLPYIAYVRNLINTFGWLYGVAYFQFHLNNASNDSESTIMPIHSCGICVSLLFPTNNRSLHYPMRMMLSSYQYSIISIKIKFNISLLLFDDKKRSSSTHTHTYTTRTYPIGKRSSMTNNSAHSFCWCAHCLSFISKSTQVVHDKSTKLDLCHTLPSYTFFFPLDFYFASVARAQTPDTTKDK